VLDLTELWADLTAATSEAHVMPQCRSHDISDLESIGLSFASSSLNYTHCLMSGDQREHEVTEIASQDAEI
jgi:hypothetical protein